MPLGRCWSDRLGGRPVLANRLSNERQPLPSPRRAGPSLGVFAYALAGPLGSPRLHPRASLT